MVAFPSLLCCWPRLEIADTAKEAKDQAAVNGIKPARADFIALIPQ